MSAVTEQVEKKVRTGTEPGEVSPLTEEDVDLSNTLPHALTPPFVSPNGFVQAIISRNSGTVALMLLRFLLVTNADSVSSLCFFSNGANIIERKENGEIIKAIYGNTPVSARVIRLHQYMRNAERSLFTKSGANYLSIPHYEFSTDGQAMYTTHGRISLKTLLFPDDLAAALATQLFQYCLEDQAEQVKLAIAQLGRLYDSLEDKGDGKTNIENVQKFLWEYTKITTETCLEFLNKDHKLDATGNKLKTELVGLFMVSKPLHSRLEFVKDYPVSAAAHFLATSKTTLPFTKENGTTLDLNHKGVAKIRWVKETQLQSTDNVVLEAIASGDRRIRAFLSATEQHELLVSDKVDPNLAQQKKAGTSRSKEVVTKPYLTITWQSFEAIRNRYLKTRPVSSVISSSTLSSSSVQMLDY